MEDKFGGYCSSCNGRECTHSVSQSVEPLTSLRESRGDYSSLLVEHGSLGFDSFVAQTLRDEGYGSFIGLQFLFEIGKLTWWTTSPVCESRIRI